MERKTNKTIHYAWAILIVCFIMFAFTAGTLLNCNGIFHTAICADTGWKYSDYIVSNLFYGIGSIFALLFVNKLYQRLSMKWMLTIATAIFSAGYALRAYMNTIAEFSVLNFIIGMAGAFLIYVPIPILINRWFYQSKSLALGIAGTASGVGGAIASPILASWIENYGWRTASILNGLISLVIVCPLLGIFIVDNPEIKGLKAFGLDRDIDLRISDEANEKIKEALSNNSHLFNKKNDSTKIILCIIFAFLAQLIATLCNQFTNYSNDLGYGIVLGATMLSVSMVGNIVGKAVQGVSMDKYGKKRTTIIFILIAMAGCVFLILGARNKTFLFIGALGIGLSATNTTIVPPLLVDTFAKGDRFAKAVSKVTFGTYIGAMFSAYIPGLLRDATGDYILTFVLYAIANVVCMIIAIGLLKGKEWA